jgi:hypothetical protein
MQELIKLQKKQGCTKDTFYSIGKKIQYPEKELPLYSGRIKNKVIN